MEEYVTDAIVLLKDPLRDMDVRYAFFTKKFGKVTGRATSARKITSKLAGHLEPGTFAKVRFVERNHGGMAQIVDALKYGRAGVARNPGALHSLSLMLAEAEPDMELWEILKEPDRTAGQAESAKPAEIGELSTAMEVAESEPIFPWVHVLRILGWDPRGAACSICGSASANSFFIPRQEFFCKKCASKLSRNALLLISY